MRTLDAVEVEAVGGALSPEDGAVAILCMLPFAPVGFAMGFGLAVGGGLLYAAYALR